MLKVGKILDICIQSCLWDGGRVTAWIEHVWSEKRATNEKFSPDMFTIAEKTIHTWYLICDQEVLQKTHKMNPMA